MPAIVLRVALVEDNPHWRAQLRRWTVAAGHRVVQETGAADAARSWLAQHEDGWDLLVLDAFLAQGNGFTLLRHVRRTLAQQRVVMVSNFARAEARQQALALGADRFFDKGTELDAFVDYCFAPHLGQAPADAPAAPA